MTEKVREIRKSKKIETEQKFFPGYLLVEMELTDDTWHLVRSTPKVTGFVGSGNKPVALPAEEVEGILKQMEEGVALWACFRDEPARGARAAREGGGVYGGGGGARGGGGGGVAVFVLGV